MGSVFTLVNQFLTSNHVVGLITSEADLRSAITAVSNGGTAAATNTAFYWQFTQNITLAADLPAIALASGSSLQILGQGNTLDGGGSARGLYVYAGSVTLDHLTIADAVARGLDGITGVDGGGGAGGLGGGLFIAQTGSVTLSSVNFLNDSAIGGNGGIWVGPGNVGTVIGAAGGFGFGGDGGVIGGRGGCGAGGGAGAGGG
ncbi:MAG: hypothetical protein NT133_06995, partial [Alphaproteobacteria bacterium]|nr:hypothetical protein [Alphaproteobacteria bacterium]